MGLELVDYAYMTRQQKFIETFAKWANQQSSISGALLVGSQARGTAREDSDVDLVLIVSNPSEYLQSDDWIKAFGESSDIRHEDFGLVQSRRAFFGDGIEVEFGITTLKWLKTDPIDAGTKRVMSDGYRVLDDKAGLIATFAEKSGI